SGVLMVWGLSQRGAAPTAERRGARLWWCRLFAAGRCSYRGAEMCSAFVVRPFRSEALLLQAILELLIRCRSSAPAANGAQRAPAGCNRSPARRGLWRVEHTASSPAWTIIPDGHD